MRTGGSGARGEQAFCTLHGLSYFIVFIYGTLQASCAYSSQQLRGQLSAYLLIISSCTHTHTVHTVHTVHTRGFSTRQHSRSQHVRCQS